MLTAGQTFRNGFKEAEILTAQQMPHIISLGKLVNQGEGFSWCLNW